MRNDAMSASYASGWAGGKDTAVNSRDRYNKANFNKPSPFGTSNTDTADTWAATSKQYQRPQTAAVDNRIAGAPSR